MLYHVPVLSLAERVLAHIRREELLRVGDRVGVAVSGGIDSVALLRLLLELRHELGVVLSVVHFNHKLRGAEAVADQEFVADLASAHGLELYCDSGDVAALAADSRSSVEAAARELRYGFFHRLLGAQQPPEVEAPQGLKPDSLVEIIGTAEAVPFPNPTPAVGETSQFSRPSPAILLNKIATGHTLDDQAETVLMRLIRGTGMRGLGGIFPRIVLESDEEGEEYGEIVRPILGVRRSELERYLTEIQQPWREDSTNADVKFTRNRVRKLLLPMLEQEFNPTVAENLAELAEIARDEEDYWDNEVSGWLGTVVQWSEPEWVRPPTTSFVQIQPSGGDSSGRHTDADLQSRIDSAPWLVINASVSRPWLLTEPRAVQRRVVKSIAERVGIPLEFRRVEEILRFAAEEGPKGKELSLPLGWKIARESETIAFITPNPSQQQNIGDYEYRLPVTGRALVPELGSVFELVQVQPDSKAAEYNSQQLLCSGVVTDAVVVRNWRPGDRFWPAHTKAPKKVKELLQELHVAQPERRLWPVVVNENGIIWMRGFPVPSNLRAKPGEKAILIRERSWAQDENPI